MADMINDALIKRYQQWYKENKGTTLDKYTARSHLKQLLGRGSQSSGGGSSGGMQTVTGRQAYDINASGGYGAPVMMSGSSLLPPVAHTGSYSRGTSYSPFIKGLEEEYKAIAKAREKADERAYNESRDKIKSRRALEKELRKEIIDIESAVDNMKDEEFSDKVPVEIFKDPVKAAEYINDLKTAEKKKRIDSVKKHYDIGEPPPVAVKKAVKAKTVMEEESGPRHGGGSITVTGDAKPGDSKKGTIAITGGNPDNPKQWIFEPTDDGNYIAKRPVPGSFNKWETGKVVSPGDLYDMTKGEFGTKPQVDETPAVPEPTPSAKPQPQEAWGSGYGPVSGKIQYPENYDVGGYVPEKTLAPTPQEPVREPYTGYEGKGFGDVGRLAQDVYGSAGEALNSAKDAWNSDWGGRRGLTPEGFSDAPDYEPELTPEDEELLRQMEEERMMEERMKWAEAQSWQDKRLSPDNYNMDEGGDYGWY